MFKKISILSLFLCVILTNISYVWASTTSIFSEETTKQMKELGESLKEIELTKQMMEQDIYENKLKDPKSRESIYRNYIIEQIEEDKIIYMFLVLAWIGFIVFCMFMFLKEDIIKKLPLKQTEAKKIRTLFSFFVIISMILWISIIRFNWEKSLADEFLTQQITKQIDFVKDKGQQKQLTKEVFRDNILIKIFIYIALSGSFVTWMIIFKKKKK